MEAASANEEEDAMEVVAEVVNGEVLEDVEGENVEALIASLVPDPRLYWYRIGARCETPVLGGPSEPTFDETGSFGMEFPVLFP